MFYQRKPLLPKSNLENQIGNFTKIISKDFLFFYASVIKFKFIKSD